MPVHMWAPFPPDLLQQAELHPPFAFSKGCPVLRLPARPWTEAHPFGTLLFDLERDPGQDQPIQDAQGEANLTAQMRRMMQVNDAPIEQYERLGFEE